MSKRGQVRSYVAKYHAVSGGTMLGGVRSSTSSRFGSRFDAEERLSSAIEINASAGVKVAGRVEPSTKPPEIFSHCEGTPAQTVGGRCFGCRKMLTAADAREYAR